VEGLMLEGSKKHHLANSAELNHVFPFKTKHKTVQPGCMDGNPTKWEGGTFHRGRGTLTEPHEGVAAGEKMK
jgi:hypothetical protein